MAAANNKLAPCGLTSKAFAKISADKCFILQMSKKQLALLSKFRQTAASSRTMQACKTLAATTDERQ